MYDRYWYEEVAGRIVGDRLKYQRRADQRSRESMAGEIEELRLVVAALVRVLMDKGAFVPAELEKAAREIDLLDRAADGRLHGRVETDGQVKAQPHQPSPLDELAQAVDGESQEK